MAAVPTLSKCPHPNEPTPGDPMAASPDVPTPGVPTPRDPVIGVPKEPKAKSRHIKCPLPDVPTPGVAPQVPGVPSPRGCSGQGTAITGG
ncbi:hypothetical protein Nmel_018011 [Mimus melanotis]